MIQNLLLLPAHNQTLLCSLFCFQQSCFPQAVKKEIELSHDIFCTGGIRNCGRRSNRTCRSSRTLWTSCSRFSSWTLWTCRSGRAVYLCTTLDFPLCWIGKPLDCLVLNHSDNVVVILDVINNSLVLVGKIEVNRYFPVLMHPNRFYEFNHNPAVKALNVFVFQKGG